MGLVLYALKYRITCYVAAILVVLAGIGAAIVAPKDVLPTVDIPVVVVVWTYTGLNATDMAQRITTYSEFSLSNNVNNIKRMESTTLPGTAVERIYFQQNVSIDLAIAQVVSAMNSIRAAMPPGIQPPIIMRFSASSVPVIQLSLSSKTESQAKLYDYGQYRIRQTLTQVPGSTLPSPYGGAPRQVMVDLDLHALQGYGLTPLDVTNAIVAQNLVVPSGLSKIGGHAISDPDQCVSASHRRPQPGAHQGRPGLSGADPRRCLRARRVPAAIEHRPLERDSLDPGDHPQERRSFHPLGRGYGQVLPASKSGRPRLRTWRSRRSPINPSSLPAPSTTWCARR